MTANSLHPRKRSPLTFVSPDDVHKQDYRFEHHFADISVPEKQGIFHPDDSTLLAEQEKRSHWSTAWSDLMMTMFILFLSLFVYQAAQKDFLIKDDQKLAAADSTKRADIKTPLNSSFPFPVINPGLPTIPPESHKKVEQIVLDRVDIDSTFSSAQLAESFNELKSIIGASNQKQAAQIIRKDASRTASVAPVSPFETPQEVGSSSINSFYVQSRDELDSYNLEQFATINLVPDKAVRIVLKGDLLFATGEAALSQSAVESLEKVAAIIKKTPHRIHIEGHTDNVPILSGRFASNWELSAARANAVATFLIDDMGMRPEQFVVSGYASYNPKVPNTTEANKAKNRRVEIVVTKGSSPSYAANLHSLSPVINTL